MAFVAPKILRGLCGDGKFSKSPILMVQQCWRAFSGTNTVLAGRVSVLKFPDGVPAPPKRPTTAFLDYSLQIRGQVKAENPELSMADVSRKCAEKWKSLDEREKQPYVESYNKRKEEYHKQVAAFESTVTKDQLEIINRVREEKKRKKKASSIRQKLRQLNKPKGPQNAFNFFCADNLHLRESGKYTDFLKIMGKKWKEASDLDREVYVKKSLDDNRRFDKEMMIWEGKMRKEGYGDLIAAMARTKDNASRIEFDRPTVGVATRGSKKKK